MPRERTPDSWRGLPLRRQPGCPDATVPKATLERIRHLPPLVRAVRRGDRKNVSRALELLFPMADSLKRQRADGQPPIVVEAF